MAELKLIPKTPFVVDKQLDRLVFPFTVRDPKGLRFWEIQPAVDEFKARVSADKGISLKSIKLNIVSPELADLLVREYPRSVIPFSPFVVNAAVAYGKPEDNFARFNIQFRTKDGWSVDIKISSKGILADRAFAFSHDNYDGDLLSGRNAFLIERFFDEYAFNVDQELKIIRVESAFSIFDAAGADIVFIPLKSGWYKPDKGKNAHLLVPCEATDPQAIGYARAEGQLFAPIVRRVAGLGDDSKTLFIDSDPDTAYHNILLEMPKPVHQAERDLVAKMETMKQGSGL